MNALRVGHPTPAALRPSMNTSAESQPTAGTWPTGLSPMYFLYSW